MSKGYEVYLTQLFLPVARYCVKRGIRIQQIIEAAKSALIQAADEEVRNFSKEPNVSKIAISTGLHRRDVMRLWRDEKKPKLDQNLYTKIVNLWERDKKYNDNRGKPKLLSYKGKASEFIKLVSSVTQDLNPYTILFDLERSGVVQKTPIGLKLIKQSFKYKEDRASGMKFLSEDIGGLISAIDENIHEVNETPNLHIRTEYDNIPNQFSDTIREWLLEHGKKFHEKLREYLSSYDRDTNPEVKGSGKTKVTVGAFSCITNNTTDATT